jgi:hypothetical protein
MFYVVSKSANTLNWFVKDETGVRTDIQMTLHFPADDISPLPARTEFFSADSADFVVGHFVITNGTRFSVLVC